jgi:signal transduction histidine kinase
VEQVLLNLLSNAIKFTERGTVRVKASQANGAVCIEVSDTGPGIPSERLGELFKPFSQVDSGLDRRHEGAGLGLSICKRLVERHGGRIWVEQGELGGSRFCFTIPDRDDS